MKRLLVSLLLAGALVGCSFTNVFGPQASPQQPNSSARVPEIHSAHGVVSFHLFAQTLPNGYPAFVYNGQLRFAPTIYVNPGDTIAIDLTDELTNAGMAGDVNLHFHGLGVSPLKPSDDVVTMLATPGQTLHYRVQIPRNQQPGLYWYHTHVHGETNYQVSVGDMSGAIVVQGLANSYPELSSLAENVVVVREAGGSIGDRRFDIRKHLLTPNVPCPVVYQGFLTANNDVDPTIAVPSGKPAFFGVVNATGHRTLDLSLSGAKMQIYAVDGYALRTAGVQPIVTTHYVVPPAGRLEFTVKLTKKASLITLCYNAGPVGDQDPLQPIVELRPKAASAVAPSRVSVAPRAAPAPVPAAILAIAAHRLVTFSEDANGFYINGKAYDPSAPPMFVVHTGTVEEWTVQNVTYEMHDFHLHQVHFMVTSIGGVPVAHPIWTDTFVVPWATTKNGKNVPGSVKMLADFRSKIIKGTFLFHCHILDHEDNGMMAKIQAI